MIDVNGKYEPTTLDDAQVIIREKAALANVEILSGSVEEQIANWLAQAMLAFDNSLFRSHQLEFFPVGSDLDLQNPNTPRLQPTIASGFLMLTNSYVEPIAVPLNSIFTAPNGNQYTNGNNTVTVPGNDEAPITVFSLEKGIEQNLPSNQTFIHSLGGTITAVNPQPFVNGRDLETDTEYYNRIVYLQTNHTSQQATPAAVQELQDFYEMALIYVNNLANETDLPIQIPPQGYIPVVHFPSGKDAGPEEIANAIGVLSRRFEFGNPKTDSTALHPILISVVYTGVFPQNFYVVPAQAVKSTVSANLQVSFLPNTDASEKNLQAVAFAKFFIQNIVNLFGGAEGQTTVTFNPLTGPNVLTVVDIEASKGINKTIAPAFSIEQIRALISDASNLAQLTELSYQACTVLTYVLDPQEAGEVSYTLNIAGPTISIDFKKSALFSDYTAWYDRYIFIDPSLISITVEEVAA